jgi:ankyrin repeat protein
MLNGNKDLLNKSINQYPPIYHAVRCGHYDVTEFFLKAGCSMDFTQHKSTPMHCAVYYGYANIIPLLIAYGMPTDIKNKYDHYPIEEAASDEIKEILEKMKVNHIYKLQKDLLGENLMLSSININEKNTNKKIITKLIHQNYSSFHNNPQYDRAFHGTLLSSALSIMKLGLKKPGD